MRWKHWREALIRKVGEQADILNIHPASVARYNFIKTADHISPTIMVAVNQPRRLQLSSEEFVHPLGSLKLPRRRPISLPSSAQKRTIGTIIDVRNVVRTKFWIVG